MLLHGHFFWPKVSVAVHKFNSLYLLTSQKCFTVHTAAARFEGQISDLFSQSPHEALRTCLSIRNPPTGIPSRSNTSLTNYPIRPSINRPPPSQNEHIVIDVFDHESDGEPSNSQRGPSILGPSNVDQHLASISQRLTLNETPGRSRQAARTIPPCDDDAPNIFDIEGLTHLVEVDPACSLYTEVKIHHPRRGEQGLKGRWYYVTAGTQVGVFNDWYVLRPITPS